MKPENLVIGLDCSTTGTKAIAFNHRGRIAAQAQEATPLLNPQAGYYEQEPEDWWRAARSAVRAVTRKIDPARIVALAISNQRETFVPLDVNGSRLRRAIVWLDERCREHVEPFAREIGRSRIHRLTGKPVDYAPSVYRLAWMKDREPSLFRKIGMVCDVHSYLAWRLTGRFRTSWASADPLGLFNLKSKKWSLPILHALGMQEDQLPETYSPGTILGTLTQRAAHSTGLSPNTLVVAGGGDGQCAGLGTGALTAGQAYLNIGTALVAGVFGEEYRTCEAFRTMASCSRSGYYYECSLRAGTFSLDWFMGKIMHVEPRRRRAAYRTLEREARRVRPGSAGVLYLPYLCGVMNPYWDVSARGAFVGLSSSHHRGHLYRAMLEGIAYELLLAADAVVKENGTETRAFVAVGGGAQSSLWCSILADVLGKDIVIPGTTQASALGAAIAAAVGAGWFGSFDTAAKEMTSIKGTVSPNPVIHKVYLDRYQVYRELYPALRRIERIVS